MERPAVGTDVNVLDGVALVMGSAIASVHILRIIRSGLSAWGWALVCGVFVWVGMTASGPFVFLARSYSHKQPGYPHVGDRLWAVLGMPWVITAIIQSALPGGDHSHSSLFSSTLSISLAIACAVAVAVTWGTWVVVSPEQAARVEATPWTSRIGLLLSIAWPVQCGLGMIVLS
jgi:hypothetical protein